jgi:hypothetical protein
VILFEGTDTPAAALQHFCYFVPPIVQTADMTLVNSLLTMGPPDMAAGVSKVPGSSAMVDSYTWTADKDGYVYAGALTGSVGTNNGVYVKRNGQTVIRSVTTAAGQGIYGMFQVRKNDVIVVDNSSGVNAKVAWGTINYYPPVANASLYVPTAQTELINFPNQWVADQEYDFGNNLYGKRITGTITAAAGAAHDIQVPIPNISGMVDSGGWIKRGSDEYQWALGTSGALTASPTSVAVWSRVIVNATAGRFNFNSFSISARTGDANSQYDVWIKYTK